MTDTLIVDTLKNTVLGVNAELCNTLDDKTDINVHSYVFNETLTAIVLTVVFALSCWIIYRHKSIVRSILIFPFSKFSEENIRESSDSNIMKVLQICTFSYFFSMFLGLLKFGEYSFFSEKSHIFNEYGIVIFMICFAIYYIYGKLLNGILTWYDTQNTFFRELLFEKNLICSFLGIIVVPCTIFTVFTPENTFFYTKYVYLFVAIASITYYLAKIYTFFKTKKVSFLQYILYFCIVDFVPISLFYTIIDRYLGV
ncbi:MAG: DUF4271 domain-containing protein [Rikenellaceae bacterium]